MKKLILFISLLTSVVCNNIYPETEVKCTIDVNNIFEGRIRTNFDLYNLSLIWKIDSDGLNYIEPFFKTPVMSIGRIYLKGLFREMCNPDSINITSSLIGEKTALNVTDSFGRSSRYGFFVSPRLMFNLYGWGYILNSGGISSGFAADNIDIINLRYFGISTGAIVSASSYKEEVSSSWFNDSVMSPQQMGLNSLMEMRLRFGENTGQGRKIQFTRSEKFSTAFSFMGAASLPQYTKKGWLIRSFFSTGNRNAYLRGMLQAESDLYISGNGVIPKNK
ncbi:MAG: hypothetical protein PQJ46_07095, partial [Spirochaetales bacterium]|nr:hypothetical protein [Spirochaetales bacterium]